MPFKQVRRFTRLGEPNQVKVRDLGLIRFLKYRLNKEPSLSSFPFTYGIDLLGEDLSPLPDLSREGLQIQSPKKLGMNRSHHS